MELEPLTDEEKEMLKGQIRKIVERIDDFFEGDDEKVLAWFATSNPFLRTSPIAMILDGKLHQLLAFIEADRS